MYITGNSGEWECVIGLEVHAQIVAKSKLFSNAATTFGASPNSNVSLIDAAMPGMLPMLNEHCVHQAIKTGLALNAQINQYSVFDRKNYFYPDLPQGYQISQFYHPIVQKGYLSIQLPQGHLKQVRINRLHLEQDAGKSMHDQSPSNSLIDLNRCGIALMEIVTEPDLRSADEAAEYLKKLQNLLRYIGTCDGDMDKGSMRCDANVSVRRPGQGLGTRCEIKNLNSIKNLVKAIEFEALRQIELLERQEQIQQETRLFDANSGTTRAMRLKEEANDYRYFPDPDLLPVIIAPELIETIKKTLPELPDAKLARYVQDLGLSEYDAGVIVADEEVARYFESSCQLASPKMVANWLTTELFGYLNKYNISLQDCRITPSALGRLVKMVEEETISGKMAKNVFDKMFNTGEDPEQIVAKESLIQVSDRELLFKVIDEVMLENADAVAAYRSGKEKLFGFFVGQVMKKTQNRANPALVNELLAQKLA